MERVDHQADMPAMRSSQAPATIGDVSRGGRAPSATGRFDRLPEALSILVSRRRARRNARALAAIGDIAAMLLAFGVAGLIRFGTPLHPQVGNLLGALLPAFVLIAAQRRAYNIGAIIDTRQGSMAVLHGLLIAIAVIGLVTFFLKVSSDFSRAVLGMGTAGAVVLLPIGRALIAGFARQRIHDAITNDVVIEDGAPAHSCGRAVVLNAREHGLEPRLDDPDMLDRLGRYLKHADRVIVACQPERRLLWTRTLKGADINGEIFAGELDQFGAVGLAQLGGKVTLVVASGPLGIIDRAVKRALDLTILLLTAPVTIPVALAVTLAVKLDSPGPVFFSQMRVGLGNRMFRMHKFRSMKVASLDHDGLRSTGREDDRVTRVGRFIRATSLDELPQLFNVLMGAMSIVGPRPHALGSRAGDQLFWDIDHAYWHRHAVKPGMTGLAQVRGFRGTTQERVDLENRLQADLEYLAGWTLWRDIAIIFATFRVMMHRNAY